MANIEIDTNFDVFDIETPRDGEIPIISAEHTLDCRSPGSINEENLPLQKSFTPEQRSPSKVPLPLEAEDMETVP